MKRDKNINKAAAALWASAFVLGGLVITQAGRLPGNPAYGGMATAVGDYVLVTADTGRGDSDDRRELLFVIDSRDEILLAYEVENARNKEIILRGGASLPVWFRDARR